jgi:hypothetical protein
MEISSAALESLQEDGRTDLMGMAKLVWHDAWRPEWSIVRLRFTKQREVAADIDTRDIAGSLEGPYPCQRLVRARLPRNYNGYMTNSTGTLEGGDFYTVLQKL